MSSKILKTFFESQAKHHVQMAKAHRAIMDDSDEEAHQNFHSTAADSHTSAGEACVECARECIKAAAGDDELSKLAPTGISGIVPVAPQNIRAVLRAGQRDFSEVTAPVDLALEKIFAIE